MHTRHLNSSCLHLKSLGQGPASPALSCLVPGFCNLGMASGQLATWGESNGVNVFYNCRREHAVVEFARKVYYFGVCVCVCMGLGLGWAGLPLASVLFCYVLLVGPGLAWPWPGWACHSLFNYGNCVGLSAYAALEFLQVAWARPSPPKPPLHRTTPQSHRPPHARSPPIPHTTTPPHITSPVSPGPIASPLRSQANSQLEIMSGTVHVWRSVGQCSAQPYS